MVARAKYMVDEDARISTDKIASALYISSVRASFILLYSHGYCKVCARWILAPQLKRDKLAYPTALLKMCDNCDPRYLDELVTGGETWPYYFEPLR